MANDNQLGIDIVINPAKAEAQVKEFVRTAESIFAASETRKAQQASDGIRQTKQVNGEYQDWWKRSLMEQDRFEKMLRSAQVEDYRHMLQRQVADAKAAQQQIAATQAATPQGRLEGLLGGLGVKSPQQNLQGIKDTKDALALLESQGIKSGVVVDQLNTKMRLFETGNARGRGEIHKYIASLASFTFEMTGAVYGITALASVIAAPAFFGTAMLKRIEDAQTGITGILISMGTLEGKSLTFGQAWKASGEYVKAVQADSMKYGIDMGKLMEVNQAAMSGGLNAMMNLEQIQKVATAGAIAVSSLGLNSQQYVQEVRDLISGGIQPASSTLARSIGVTDALLKQWKAQGPDKLVKELTDRLQGFMVVADEVRTKTLTGAWDILQARLSMLLSDEQGFGAIKKAVIDLANYIGSIDPITKKFELNKDLVIIARDYWDALKAMGGVLLDLGKAMAIVAENIAKIVNALNPMIPTIVKAIELFAAFRIGGWIIAGLGSLVTSFNLVTASALSAAKATEMLTLSTRANIAATTVWQSMIGKFGKGGLIGMALFGAYVVADYLGWLDQIFGSATKRVDEFSKALKGASLSDMYDQRHKLQVLMNAEDKSWIRNGELISQYRQQLSLLDREITRSESTDKTKSFGLKDITGDTTKGAGAQTKTTIEKVSEYQKMIDKIKEFNKANDDVVKTQEKQTAGDKLLADVEVLLTNTKIKRTASELAALKTLRDSILPGEKAKDLILAEKDAKEKLKEINLTLSTAATEANAQRELEMGLIGKYGLEAKVFTEQKKYEIQLEKDLLSLKKDPKFDKIDKTTNKSYLDAVQATITASNAQRDAVIKNLEDMDRATNTWQVGASKAMFTYAEAATNTAGQIEGLMTKSFKGMEDALVSFVSTGKLSFQSLAKSIIDDLIRINIQRAMSPIFEAGGGLLGSVFSALIPGTGGAAAGASESTLSAFGPSAVPAGMTDYLNMPKFAGGGFTGIGARSGGLDGLGGFAAIMHPQETVIDHTIPNRPASSQGSVMTNQVSVSVNITDGKATSSVNAQQNGADLGNAIASAVKAELVNQRRPGGLLAA